MPNRPEVLYKLKLNEVVTTIPTIGFNVEQVQPVPGLNLTVWDIGGQTKIRPLWRHYFQNTHGIIWLTHQIQVILYSTLNTVIFLNLERFNESREELMNVLNDDAMTRGVPILVFANKQDLPNAQKPSKIVEALGVQSLRNHKWHVQVYMI